MSELPTLNLPEVGADSPSAICMWRETMRRAVSLVLLGATLCASGCSTITGGFNIGNLSPNAVLEIGENAYKAATLSDDDVKKMAASMIKELDAENTVAPPGNPYAKRLEKIVAKHKKEEGLNFNFKVYLTSTVNAFSMADGSIRIFSGLMDKMTDDELLFVIGHEIGHVKHGHRKARLQRGYAAAAAAGAVGQGLAGATANTGGGIAATIGGDILAQITAEVLKAQFSQGDETESDEFGLHLVHKRQRPLESSVTALLKLGDGGGSSSVVDQLTSSHPDPVDRAEHLKELIPTLGGKVPENLQVARSSAAGESAHEPPAASIGQSEEMHDSAPPAAVQPQGAHASASEQVFEHEEAPQAAAKPAAKHAIGSAGGNWFLQAGAFSDRGNAEALAASLEAAHHKVSVNECGALNKVLVGPFPSEEEARASVAEVGAKIGQDLPFVRRSGGC